MRILLAVLFVISAGASAESWTYGSMVSRLNRKLSLTSERPILVKGDRVYTDCVVTGLSLLPGVPYECSEKMAKSFVTILPMNLETENELEKLRMQRTFMKCNLKARAHNLVSSQDGDFADGQIAVLNTYSISGCEPIAETDIKRVANELGYAN